MGSIVQLCRSRRVDTEIVASKKKTGNDINGYQLRYS